MSNQIAHQMMFSKMQNFCLCDLLRILRAAFEKNIGANARSVGIVKRLGRAGNAGNTDVQEFHKFKEVQDVTFLQVHLTQPVRM